ncbi:MAG: PilZ domain-containing protein [Dokdonella sp.]|nr:PilZ domain-containing protein [Dokdonella sp.]
MRSARMPLRTAILISRGADSWSSEIQDISATGVRVGRPDGWVGQLGEVFLLDMLIGDSLNIHVEAELARMEEQQLGFAYARIPEDKEIPLWTLLGGYADRVERYADPPA